MSRAGCACIVANHRDIHVSALCLSHPPGVLDYTYLHSLQCCPSAGGTTTLCALTRPSLQALCHSAQAGAPWLIVGSTAQDTIPAAHSPMGGTIGSMYPPLRRLLVWLAWHMYNRAIELVASCVKHASLVWQTPVVCPDPVVLLSSALDSSGGSVTTRCAP